MISVLVVDDHMAVGLGTKALIEKYEDMQVDFRQDSKEIEELLTYKKYDVYIIDLQMPEINGLELAKSILSIHTEAAILIFTGYDVDSHYNILMENGILGVLSKTSSESQVITAIRHAVKKEVVLPYQFVRQLRIVASLSNVKKEGVEGKAYVPLNEIEKQIIIEVSKGKTNKELAGVLNLSQRSVEYKLTDIFSKLHVSSRMEAVQKAKQLGIIPFLQL